MRFYVVKQTVEYLVAEETSDLALSTFSIHGPACREVQHVRSSAGCTGEYVEAGDSLDALTELSRKRETKCNSG
jgi:hypothetical protein